MVAFHRRRFLPILLAAVLVPAFVTRAHCWSDDETEARGLVDRARVTLDAFASDPSMEWFRSNLHNARGLLIVPTLIKGGFVVGGSGGSAVLLVSDPAAGGWSQPAFYTIGSVSLGLQIGGEAAEVIMMIRTQGAVDRLLRSSFKLGADSSIAVGPAGVGGKANVMADILSFSRAKGAYAGLSLEGAVVAIRDKLNAAYYGQPVNPVDIVVTRTVANDHSAELRRSAAAITR